MARLMSSVLVAVLFLSLTLEGRCLVSCSSEQAIPAPSGGCHESSVPDPIFVAGHNCASHVAMHQAAARPERSELGGPTPAFAVEAFALHVLAAPAAEGVCDRPTPGPPLAAPRLVAIRI